MNDIGEAILAALEERATRLYRLTMELQAVDLDVTINTPVGPYRLIAVPERRKSIQQYVGPRVKR